MSIKKDILEAIIQDLIKSREFNRDNLGLFKREIAKKYKIQIPKNTTLLKTYHKLVKEQIKNNAKTNRNSLLQKQQKEIERFFRTRPIRSLSGIVNVSIFTKPYPCPGKCVFCPQEKNIPKSYLKNEPAAQRAISNNFDPRKQIITRLSSLWQTGHPLDKIEIRIIGGTWSYYKKEYKIWFIAQCFKACNEFPKNKKNNIKNKKIDLKKEQSENTKAKNKIVSISVETRPDYITPKEVELMRELGITKVELGVQSIYNDILIANKRGHSIDATIKATKLLKNAGFKVSYQIMPNLLGSTAEKDIKMFKTLFNNNDFKPDLLKIYPLALLKNTPLYKIYKQGKYKPYTKKELINLLVEIKRQIPRWCRIERVIRDIPAENIIEGGVKTSNLREVVQKTMKKQGLFCKCIRCMEVKTRYNPKEKLILFRNNYIASNGQEIFLSFENKNRTSLYSMLRLRIPNPKTNYKELKNIAKTLKGSAIIREVRTFGQMARIGKKSKLAQHKGLGKKLIKQAEKITLKEFHLNKIAIIASIGTRDYYRKLGYKLRNTYMVKKIKQ